MKRRSRPSYAGGHRLLCFSHTLQLNAGDRLGQYEILGPLGAGGMGEVYRARDAKLGRDIALKILPAELSANSEALRRFEQEARAASALNHPNIVTIYDVGQTDQRAWIAMELVDGLDVRTLAIREPLTLKASLRIAVKVADGLSAAHDRGIVHRDLKPENVMLTNDGFVKLLDFGLAKQIRVLSTHDATVPQTAPGSVFGTVGYMSPEQAMGKDSDYRADQFSLGVMLYEMLTGVRPFDRPTRPETMVAIMRDEVEPPSTINAAVSHDLDRILGRCLAKNPRDRYASTRDLTRDLREVRDGIVSSSPRLRTNSAALSPAAAIRAPYVIAATLLVALILGGVIMWMRREPAVSGPKVTSLAVLPFRDLSSTPEGRILADGISELIAARLTEVHDLRVSPPFNGSQADEGDDVAAIAKRRGVDAVVRGTVQRGNGSVRVTYALVSASAGATLLSSTATRPVTELFALEDTVAENLIHAIGRVAEPRVQPAAAILGPYDQRRFVEAVGLLQRVKDERSVDEAIATLESILRNARESGAVNALMARALLYKASLARRPALIEQATVYASRGITLSADDPDSYTTMGHLQNASGRYAEAVTAFERALALRANNPDAIVGLAEAYEGQGRGEDAEKLYTRAIALRPDAPGPHSRYGAFCYKQGRHAEAVAHFARAVELAPEFSHAHADLGGALQALGRYDEAIAAYRKSLSLESTAAGWSNLGTLQFALGRYDEAEKSYERATALAPSDYMLWANLGDACTASGAKDRASAAWERAIATAEDALSINPRASIVRSIYASCLAKAGRHGDAQAEIRRALEDDPANAVVLYQAATIAALRGNNDSATSWLERAIRAGYPATEAERDPILAQLRERSSPGNPLKPQA